MLDALLAGDPATFVEALRYSLLPAFVLALPSIAAIVRVNRAEMIEVMGADYVTAAQAHGVSPWRVIGWLALKNAMLPTPPRIPVKNAHVAPEIRCRSELTRRERSTNGISGRRPIVKKI